MVCPFFMPTERLLEGSWMHPSRLPLGAGWNGHCCSPKNHKAELSVEVIQNFCNMGYASACPNLPQERQFDSIRFAVAQDRGSSIALSYSCEREHRPAGHGKLEYNSVLNVWISSHSDVRIQKMAECYLQSYLLRRIQPVSTGVNTSAHS
jgi:hypothetical protein